jgi:hypothetical protein
LAQQPKRGLQEPGCCVGGESREQVEAEHAVPSHADALHGFAGELGRARDGFVKVPAHIENQRAAIQIEGLDEQMIENAGGFPGAGFPEHGDVLGGVGQVEGDVGACDDPGRVPHRRERARRLADPQAERTGRVLIGIFVHDGSILARQYVRERGDAFTVERADEGRKPEAAGDRRDEHRKQRVGRAVRCRGRRYGTEQEHQARRRSRERAGIERFAEDGGNHPGAELLYDEQQTSDGDESEDEQQRMHRRGYEP